MSRGSMNRVGMRSSPGATSSQRQVNAPADREVQLGDITNFAVTAYLAELTDSPRSIPGFTVIAVARPDESRVNVTCRPNDDITKLVPT